MTETVQRDLPDRLGAYEILELIPTPDHLEHYLGVTVVEFVTLTILRADAAKAAQAAKEIARSARLASSVATDDVVRTFRAEREGDLMFLVGQHLQGKWLADVVPSVGKLEPNVALRVLLDVAAGLGSIHAAATVHGDVRPASVLLCEDGRARLALLGLGPVAPLLALPEATKNARTPYRPPEELRGRAASQAGDLYSFGVLLHELFAGTVSSVGQEGMLRRHGAPEVISGFLPRLLSHTASARPTSARVVLDVLEEAAGALAPATREQMTELVASMASVPPPAPARARAAPVAAAKPAQDSGPAAVDAAAPSIRQPVVPPETTFGRWGPRVASPASVVKAPPPIPADAARIAMATPPPPPRAVSVARPPPVAEGGTPVRFAPPPAKGGKPAMVPPPSPPAAPARPPAVPAPVRDAPLPPGGRQLQPVGEDDDDVPTKQERIPTPVAGKSDAERSAKEPAGGGEGEAASVADGSAPVVTAEKTISWAGAPAVGEAKKDDVARDEAETEAKRADAKTDDGKKDEAETEAKRADAKTDDGKKDEAKKDEAKKPETTKDEAKKAEVNKPETKKDEAKKDEAKKDEAKKDEAKKPETTKDEAKKDEAKKHGAETDEARRTTGPTGLGTVGAPSQPPGAAPTLQADSRFPEPKTKAARTPIPAARPRSSRGLPAWLLVLLTLAAGAAIGAFFGLRERAAVERTDSDARRNRVNGPARDSAVEPAPELAPEPAPAQSPEAPGVPTTQPQIEPTAAPRAEPGSKAPARPPRVGPPSKLRPAIPQGPRPAAPGAASKAAAGTLQISCARPCQVRIDGAASAQSTTSGARVSAGSHAVVVTDSQTRATRTLRVYVPAGVTVRRTVGF